MDPHEARRRAARAEQDARNNTREPPRRVDDFMDTRGDPGMGRRVAEPTYGNPRDNVRGPDARLMDQRVDSRDNQRYAANPRYAQQDIDMDMDDAPILPRGAGRPVFEQERPRNVDTRMGMGNEDYYGSTTRPGYGEPVMAPPVGAAQRYPRDDQPQRNRPMVDLEPRGPSEKYNEYFLPREGISHEVIQTEISRFLGNDATVKRHRMQDGRDGYAIRAYRAPTTAMIQSLKEKTNEYERDQGVRKRAGRDPEHYDDWVSTRESGRDRVDRPDRHYRNDRNDMDIDDDYDSQGRYGNRDDREQPLPRTSQAPGRQPAVVSGYPQDPSQYYTIGSNQTQMPVDQYDQRNQPRTLVSPAGTTPPPQAARIALPAYGQQASFPVSTQTQATRVSVPGSYATDNRGYTTTTGNAGRTRHA